MKIGNIICHRSITRERVLAAVERRMFGLDNPGFCIVCGEEAEGVEPDARRYKCEHCGECTVYGADEIAMRMAQRNNVIVLFIMV